MLGSTEMPLNTTYNMATSYLESGWSSATANMPSIRSLSGLALSAITSAQYAFALNNPIARQNQLGASATCSNPQLSCHNTTAVSNLCCFNAPGGSLLQTQFWDTNPVTGPSDSWTIHGLWPDNCDGTYQSTCDPSRAYTNITQILQSYGETALLNYMDTYWVSDSGTAESFWEHEWAKHGTCISTLDPNCYTSYQPTEEVPDFFNRTVSLFQSLPSYQWLSDAGITPSSSATYTTAQIQAALSKNHGGKNVYLGCQSGALTEIWYFFNVAGSVQTGNFEPSDLVGSASTCPSTGIKYLPKGSGSSPSTSTTTGGSGTTSTAASTSKSTTTGGTGTTTSSAPTSTSTGSFSGSGYLNVVSGGSQQGCIISKGTWYTTGTCATFKATSSGFEFTLSSSKGNCAIVSGALSCASTVSAGTAFSADGETLVYNGAETFYANGVPSGSTQNTVYTSSSGHATELTLEWQSL